MLCLCALLACIFLIGPESLQTLAHGAVVYADLNVDTWGNAGDTFSYFYDANGSVEYKYNGNYNTLTAAQLSSDDYDHYEYNLQGRLAKFTKHRSEGVDDVEYTTTYTYNPSGIRTGAYSCRKVNGGAAQDEVTTTYLVDPDNHTGYAQVLQETITDSTSTEMITYTIGDDIITQASTVSGVKHLLYDGHGSTRQLADASGNVAAADNYNYDAYGMLLGGNPTAASPAATNYLYTGEQYDNNLQQYYLRARYYNPSTGCFNRTDPYAGSSQDPQSLHKYLYCHANPINGNDPEGLGFTAIGQLVVTSIRNTLERIHQIYETSLAPFLYFNAYRAFMLYMWWLRTLPLILFGLTLFDITLSVLDNMAAAWLNNTQPIPTSHVDRGVLLETVAGANLRRNFPKIDDWRAATGMATSIKTHASESSDLLLKQIERDVEVLNNIEGTTLSGIAANGSRVTIQAGEIQTKCLLVGIPQAQARWLMLQSFRTSIQRLQTSTRCVIRVVPVKGWKK